MTPAEELAAAKKNAPKKKVGDRKPRKVLFRCGIAPLRKRLKLSLRDVEKATGLMNCTVLSAEEGMGVSLLTAIKLARFFGKTVEELWQEIK